MKDEELAEEWISSAEYQRDRPIEPFSTDECSNDWAELSKYAEYMLPKAFLAGLTAGRPQWHKLSEKYPDADKIVRVRLMSGMEHICETCYYEPTEDEVGYGKLIINFYELNGEWVDDNDIIAWCEIPTFDKE